MDKNSTIGLLLIGGIIIAFSFLNKSDTPIDNGANTDSIPNTTKTDKINAEYIKPALVEEKIDLNDSVSNQLAQEKKDKLTLLYGGFAESIGATESFKTVETDKLILKFSSKGGRLIDAQLKEYVTHDSIPVKLWVPESLNFGFELNLGSGVKLRTDSLDFKAIEDGFTLDGDDERKFPMRLYYGSNNKYVELVYTIKAGTYDVGLDINFVGLENILNNNANILLNWNLTAYSKEKSAETERRTSTVMYKYDGSKRDYLSEGSDDEEELEEKILWVAYKQNFFSAILRAVDGFHPEGSKVNVKVHEGTDLLKSYGATLNLPLTTSGSTNKKLEFYLGPNRYKVLKEYDTDYYQIIDLGWGIFGWVNKYLVIPIFNMLGTTGMSYGIIILLLTVIIKLILFPLTYKNYLSSAKMKVLKPDIDELGKKYKPDESMKKQQAVMALYKKAGVNPMAGCVPMVIQMPILYAMFRFFPSSIELRQKSFLWAEDLSAYDSIYDLGFNIPFYGDHISLFTLFMAGSTILYTSMNSGQMNMNQDQPGMPNMKVMMYMFPVMMMIFFNNYSSALSYYYFTANVITMAQMLIIKKYFVNEGAIKKVIEENKSKPGKAKKSKFQQRLEDMAKLQQAKKKG